VIQNRSENLVVLPRFPAESKIPEATYARYGEQSDSCNQPSRKPSAGDGMGNS